MSTRMSHAARVEGCREVFHKADALSVCPTCPRVQVDADSAWLTWSVVGHEISFCSPGAFESKLQPVCGSRWNWPMFACCEMVKREDEKE